MRLIFSSFRNINCIAQYWLLILFTISHVIQRFGRIDQIYEMKHKQLWSYEGKSRCMKICTSRFEIQGGFQAESVCVHS